ncbi:MAG TPA: hypothetical protein DCZ92_05550 [Elusimicrobia bacterium]|nr:MAG: hypothetical protein A2016_06755 [Elusimicrobia bacterium GWF2_62_30]HBA60270.1 hypothetical protein [Elusimicrobiota bacterium]
MKTKIFLVLVAGLAPAAWCGDAETMRVTQLTDISARSVMERPALPQPELVKLDLCVLSEMKNNKCYFKCQSGAILIEPAVRPDFSTGEPAGPCEPYITREIKTAPQKFLNSSQVNDLLKDQNPEVRKAAVKSAKAQIGNSSTQEQVLEMFKNKQERADIRVEAARTLSYVVGNSRVQDAMRDLLKYGGAEPRELRVMTYKALWGATNNYSVQDFLLDAVKYSEKDPAARRAAVWALFNVCGNYTAQDALVSLIKYGNEDEATRVEAIKSLFGSVVNYNIKDLFKDLARSASEKKAVRLAAIKALAGAANDYAVQDLLKDMIRSERDAELRVAAVNAANPDMNELREYFHLGYRLENGVFVNPIEKE